MTIVGTRYEHITIRQDGTPVIADTTMKVVELVVEKIAYGWSPEELYFQHPPCAKVAAGLAQRGHVAADRNKMLLAPHNPTRLFLNRAVTHRPIGVEAVEHVDHGGDRLIGLDRRRTDIVGDLSVQLAGAVGTERTGY